MTERFSVEVSGALLDRILEAVEVGDYTSPEDVLAEALRMWGRSRSEEIMRLRELVEEARASGSEPWEGAAVIAAKARAEFEAEKHIPYRAA